MKRFKFYLKKIKFNRKKPFILGFLFLLCLGVTVGYAFLTTTLNINGTVNMASSRWDIHFENVNVTSGSVTATTPPNITNDTTIAFAATLENPGEFYEFTVDVVNDGTYDARISSLEITPVLTEDESKYFDYKVQYTTGFDVKEEDILLSGRRREIKVTVLYKINEDNSNYPEEDKNFPFEIVIDYEQLGKNYNPCTYEGELTNNASYQNGQYTYTYSTTNNGWSVGLTDRNSTDPVTTKLCTSINGKPIVNMSGMFASSKASSIDLSSFDTSHVTNMNAMFASTSNIKNLDFSSFDTSNVTNMNAMFVNSSSLEKLDLSDFDTSKVTDLSSMFTGAISLTSLNASGFDTSKVTNMSGILSGTYQLENINFSGWDFSKINIPNNSSLREILFGNTSSNTTIKNLNFSNTIFGSNMNKVFAYFPNIESINLHGVDTSQATNMSALFYGDSSLQNINLSDFNTSNVTNMSAMFYGNSSLEALDLSDLETANVTSMSGIFEGVNNLTELNLSNWTLVPDYPFHSMIDSTNHPLIKKLILKNVKFGRDMSQAFSIFLNLEEMDLSGVDTTITQNMSSAFESFPLSSVNLSDLDFDNVENASYMFYNSSLENVNLSGKNSPKISNIGNMFLSCSNLKTVNLDGFGSDALNSYDDLFYNSLNIEEISMKNFNFGTGDTIGFSLGPFVDHSNLIRVDLSGSKMAGVSNLSFAFRNCTSLRVLNLSNIYAPIPISNVSQMFQNASSLTEIDLSSFTFENNSINNAMFSGVTATVGYAKTQADADYLNSITGKPSGLVFTVKS